MSNLHRPGDVLDRHGLFGALVSTADDSTGFLWPGVAHNEHIAVGVQREPRGASVHDLELLDFGL